MDAPGGAARPVDRWARRIGPGSGASGGGAFRGGASFDAVAVHGAVPPPAPRLSLLGTPQVRRDQAVLPLGPPLQQAMLVMLALSRGASAGSAELIDGMWGHDHPPTAARALRNYANRLRNLLEPGRGARVPSRLLHTAGDGYRLEIDPVRVDVVEFEDLVALADKRRRERDRTAARAVLDRALGLWRGAPLAGVPGPFAERQRARLTDLRADALAQRAALDIELGDHAAAIDGLTELVAERPLWERPRALLMRALHATGRTADALDLYTRTRGLLAEELGTDPGTEIVRTHLEILRNPVEPARQAPVPAQLPGSVADFTGRAAEVRQVIEILSAVHPTAVRVAAVSGLAGVGKTALALHAAHAVRSRFPDGQLYADLRGTGPDPADPATVLAGFLEALGVTAVPRTLAERAALYRTTLASRRVLVLLDDADDLAQVLPLLPGEPACAVLVTGRRVLAGLPGPGALHLPVLTPEEAVSMLARICGRPATERDPWSARRLVAACGHLPLAVRVAATRLRSRPAWTLHDLADRLADPHRRLDWLSLGDVGVAEALEPSHDRLTAAQARALRLLAVPDTADFGVPAAAAILDLPECRAEELCESLADAALLETGRAGRYRLHDLVRLFARAKSAGRADAAERDAALARLVAHQTAVAAEARRLLTPGDSLPGRFSGGTPSPVPLGSAAAARAWLAAERPGLFAVIRQAGSEAAVRLLLLLSDAVHLPMPYQEEAAEVARLMLVNDLDEPTRTRARALLGGPLLTGFQAAEN
ncbi:putative ATPase [Mycobacterium tuberculosis]|nr:putative ATPase [Mycobacterium tuberculosis]